MQDRMALCRDRCETMSEGNEDCAVYTQKFSNFAQIISRQAERAKMKLARLFPAVFRNYSNFSQNLQRKILPCKLANRYDKYE